MTFDLQVRFRGTGRAGDQTAERDGCGDGQRAGAAAGGVEPLEPVPDGGTQFPAAVPQLPCRGSDLRTGPAAQIGGPGADITERAEPNRGFGGL
ncbi:hypothetical protein GD627_03125 [Arthrobacter yangruifuii]|uniref:Uncharacterized protein n=1 Tax=Arthrobacter yangruifuii TaxID=2606616 RepID=A0A5N6MSB2_9MICC|nr:hypothetical protein GD627_03125 [Arthrobacter yangruifuii]